MTGSAWFPAQFSKPARDRPGVRLGKLHEALMPKTRAEYMRSYVKARRHQRRAELIEMLGGKCVRCGATEDLVFDHIDPSTKRFAVGSSMSRAWAELVAEARKCQLLCPPCHREKGVEDRPEPAHSYYRYLSTAPEN
jgi:hypothetical protein